jgi:2-oxoglutarate ferredoxin oxidoreductase subunit alpha
MNHCDHSREVSIAITGSGGAGAITAGELLLHLAGDNGCFGLMRRSFGPQIRGGEAAALIRISGSRVNCMNDDYDVLLALDWRNAERFAEEIPLRRDSLIIADPAAGAIPDAIEAIGVEILQVPLKAIAKEVPGGRENMVALGVLARWLHFDPDRAATLIGQNFLGKGEEIVAGSREAFNRGFAEVPDEHLRAMEPSELKEDHQAAARHWLMNGNEGCALGALRGGVRFAAAYPITPASDMLEWLAPRLEKLGGCLLQAEDELASINMVIGASFGGVPAMTATSGPGMALMLEAMGLAVASETPAVVINVMRGGPSTGIPTKSEQADLNQALYGMHGDAPHLVLGALDHADCILTTEWAVRLAERLQTVVVVLSDQNLAQSRVLIDKPVYELPPIEGRVSWPGGDSYQRYALTEDGVSPMAIPGLAGGMYTADGLEHTQSGKPSSAAADHLEQLSKRRRKVEDYDYGSLWADIRTETGEGGTTAIVTWGSTTGAVREAAQRLQQDGFPVKVIAIRLLLPASPGKLERELSGIERVLVIEQSDSLQFLRYLRAFYDLPGEVLSLARPGPLPITPEEIVDRVEHWG